MIKPLISWKIHFLYGLVRCVCVCVFACVCMYAHIYMALSLISLPIPLLSHGPPQCLCAQCSLNPRLAQSLGNLYGVDTMDEGADDMSSSPTPSASSSPSCAPSTTAASSTSLNPSMGLGFGYSPSDPRIPPSPHYHQEACNKHGDRHVRPRGPAFAMGPRGPAGPRRAPVHSGLTGRYLSRSIPVSLPMCSLTFLPWPACFFYLVCICLSIYQ